MSPPIDRRALLAAGLALGMAGPVLAAEDITVLTEDLPLPVGKRQTRLIVTRAARAKPIGVALFSTGHGSWPERYARLSAELAMQGYVVLAPLHVDSMHHPDRAAFSRAASFPERLADLNAAIDHAAARYPKLPVVAVGHSFGTLSALCLCGALPQIGSYRAPAVRAVLGFSTPGKIPGLIQPQAYATLAVPAMIVTGTADTVPGLVTDPADHLFPIETAPAEAKYGLVLDGAGHELVGGADAVFARALPPARLFLAAHGRGDGKARAALAAYQAAPGDRFIVRGG